MSDKSDEQNEIDAMLRRMSGEFGPRRPHDEEADEVLTPTVPPVREHVGEATAMPQPRAVSLRLPRSRPIAAWGLLGAIVLMYVLTAVLSGSIIDPANNVLRSLGWKENSLILQGQYWRLLTAMFLHGSLVHILFNGYALYALGPESERFYGTPRFLGVYFLGGLCGSIASYGLSSAPSVGASGAIFGLFGALSAFYYLGRGVLGEYSRMQLRSMASVIFINLLIGLSVPNIDNYAHMGGLVGGAIAGWLLAPRYAVDTQLYPPVLVRSYLPLAWVGMLALLVLLGLLMVAIRPPL